MTNCSESTSSRRSRGTRLLPVLPLLLVLCLAPSPGAGQWAVDLYGGRVAYDRAPSASAEIGTVLGVRYGGGDRGSFYASTGVPFGSDDSVWGATGFGVRPTLDRGAVEVGLDLGIHGYLYRDPALSEVGRGGTVGVRPLAALEGSRASAELRSGWSAHATRISAIGYTRHVHDSDLTLRVSPASWARLTGTLRHLRAEEDDYTFGGGRMTVGTARYRGWAEAGAWSSDLLPTLEWGAGAAARLGGTERTWLLVSVRQDATDPLYWNAPRERWSVGISHVLGGGATGRSRTMISGRRSASALAPSVAEGRAVFRLPDEEVDGRPSIAGAFTGWEAVPMNAVDGGWTATFRLEPGVYRYAFRSESGEWFVPEHLEGRRPDGMGGWVATLIVP